MTSLASFESTLVILFHGGQPWVNKKNGHAVNDTLTSALITPQSSITVNVSNPALLNTWLKIVPASQITTLHVHLDASMVGEGSNRPFLREKPFPSANIPAWITLFSTLARDATNLQHLSVYWDAEDYFWPGLGKNVDFVRALVVLRVQGTVVLKGHYAVHWPDYIGRKVGLKPQEPNLEDAVWSRILRKYQRGTEGIVP